MIVSFDARRPVVIASSPAPTPPVPPDRVLFLGLIDDLQILLLWHPKAVRVTAYMVRALARPLREWLSCLCLGVYLAG